MNMDIDLVIGLEFVRALYVEHYLRIAAKECSMETRRACNAKG